MNVAWKRGNDCLRAWNEKKKKEWGECKRKGSAKMLETKKWEREKKRKERKL